MPENKRNALQPDEVHPAIARKIGGDGAIVAQALEAIASHDVVVLGMRINPFPKKTRRLLEAHKIDYKYLEWGSYFSAWKDRLELKMWTGWKTFPMIFIKGVFIGGFSDLQELNNSGVLREMLKDPNPAKAEEGQAA